MKKILYIFIAIILIAGIIIVSVKGFNVSLDLRAHDTLKFVFDEKFKMDDVTKICDEVFKNKQYEVKTVEVFSDAVYIISPEINENDEKVLLEKLDTLYKSSEDIETSNTENVENSEASEDSENTDNTEGAKEETIFDKLKEGEKYKLYHDSKVRIRDIVKPYIIPSVISALIILIYIAVKYRKLENWFVLICKTLAQMAVILLGILSIIAIIRISFTTTVIPVTMFIMLVVLCVQLMIYEKRLSELDE